ncbi:hypothetical protein PROAA_220015 [Candidatus Propionivibrio aalborgensis]|uniref:Uncharacterized protein n=1 Tax=Candidatus Propionivibrio aalborgensis TaxID=1860101 RepID=A0A1A8XQP0_9RHOO|nr:hypothetical protein PROAA_220015 [Candidatus Propionivibrio aalborgensis]
MNTVALDPRIRWYPQDAAHSAGISAPYQAPPIPNLVVDQDQIGIERFVVPGFAPL